MMSMLDLRRKVCVWPMVTLVSKITILTRTCQMREQHIIAAVGLYEPVRNIGPRSCLSAICMSRSHGHGLTGSQYGLG